MKSRFVASLFLMAVAAELSAGTLDYTVGPREIVYTSKQRKKVGSWPDGSFGVVRNSQGTLDFYAAKTSTPMKTTGTLLNPAGSKAKVSISGLPKKTYSYVAGGPVFQDPESGARLMVYHAEQHSKGKYRSVLGLAASVDPNGLAFRDLGTIIEPNISFSQATHSLDVGGGSFAVLDGYMHVYFRDYILGGTPSELAVARAPLADVIQNSLSGIATPFTKYYDGGWTEPGRGGRSSPLEVGNPANWWSSVSYNDHLDQLVMVSSQWESVGADLYLATSSDGVNWSPRQPLALDAGEQMYPTIIGTGHDPQITGESFYVYYTDSQKGFWNRWKDAQLARRLVTFGDLGSPSTQPEIPPLDPPTDPLPPAPPASEWLAVSGLQADFRTGTPAEGWSYAWNPTGTLGNSSAFAPLEWSEVAQAYNTTGAATPVPAKKSSHNDDFLHLSATHGHPGKPGFSPIAGYTIQDDDGAGVYRIAESSIQKLDGVLSKGEDGLQLNVYVNDTLLGPIQTVATNGSVLNFDRELGELNVGDTVWVAVGALKNQYYDSFTNFDFSLERSVPLMTFATLASAVPEPGTAMLALLALGGIGLQRRARRD